MYTSSPRVVEIHTKMTKCRFNQDSDTPPFLCVPSVVFCWRLWKETLWWWWD